MKNYFMMLIERLQKNRLYHQATLICMNILSFIKFKGPNNILKNKNIHNCNIASEDVEKDQIKSKSDLGYIKQGNSKNKSPEQTKTINNIENLCNSEKKLFKCLMIMLTICLKIFMSQNKEQD